MSWKRRKKRGKNWWTLRVRDNYRELNLISISSHRVSSTLARIPRDAEVDTCELACSREPDVYNGGDSSSQSDGRHSTLRACSAHRIGSSRIPTWFGVGLGTWLKCSTKIFLKSYIPGHIFQQIVQNHSYLAFYNLVSDRMSPS
jgi:hypothetical protein